MFKRTRKRDIGNQNAMARVPKVAPHRPALGTEGGPSAENDLAGLKDRELVSRAQGENHAAFAELIRRHQNRVFAVASRVLHRKEDVEDVAQQTFVKAYFSLKRFDQRAAFTTWLYKITVNECWDLLRKKKVRPLIYQAELNEEQSSQYDGATELASASPDILERLANRQRVDGLLADLDERDRVMLILKEVEGFSIEEIAEIMELNWNTVKVRLFRARRKITEKVRRRGEQQAVTPEGRS
jgi:RNA polymerase sigma-70 factor (ECF subfamily)